MKTALILTAALSTAPATQPPIQMYGIQPGARMECADPGGCVAMTTGDMKRMLDKLTETCPANKKGAST